MRDAARHAAGTHSGDGGGGPSAQSDAAVIRQSLRSPEIFGELFDRHAPAIHRYVTRRLGPDVADDLVAETFLTAFRKRAAFRAEHADARPWLYGIATRLIARPKRGEVRKLRAIARTGIDPVTVCAADQATDRVAAQAARKEIAAALASLSQGQRDVLLLVASGLGYHEAATALGVPAGTVASRLVRARRKARLALGGQDPTQPEGGSE